MQYMYTVQFCVATSGVVVHCMGEVSPLIPQEMHCFKLESDFCIIFQENNPGIKWDLLVFHIRQNKEF